jgi:hypothetical protein
MIYDQVPTTDPIKQGDIFAGIPRVEISLRRIIVSLEFGEEETTWEDVVREGKGVALIAAARPVIAIVMSQDCDAIQAPELTLCEVRPFVEVHPKCKGTVSARSWGNVITQHSRANQKWYYLPPDSSMAFGSKMAVDFFSTLRVAGDELDALRHLRKGRLNTEARQHFRERIAEFFRRYPYDEWYPLDKGEFLEYQKVHSTATPRPWQT